jgi:hypothetical protein
MARHKRPVRNATQRQLTRLVYADTPGGIVSPPRGVDTFSIAPTPRAGFDRLLEIAADECGRLTDFSAIMDAGGRWLPVQGDDYKVGPIRQGLPNDRSKFMVSLGSVRVQYRGESHFSGHTNFYLCSPSEDQIAPMLRYAALSCRAGAALLASQWADPAAYHGGPGELWTVLSFCGFAPGYVRRLDEFGLQIIDHPLSATLRMLSTFANPPASGSEPLVAGPFAELADVAAGMSAKRRRVIELLVEHGGTYPKKDLAIDNVIGWDPRGNGINNGWGSMRREINDELRRARKPFRLSSRGGNAVLERLPGVS